MIISGYIMLGVTTAYFVAMYQIRQQGNTFTEDLKCLLLFLKTFKISKTTNDTVMLYVYSNSSRPYQAHGIIYVKNHRILYDDIQEFLHLSTLNQIKFMLLEEASKRALSSHLVESFHSKCDIFEVNEIIDTLYIVKSGQVHLLASDSTIIEVLEVGSIFGNFDNVNMTRSMVTATCRGTENMVILLKIKTTQFYELITNSLTSTLNDYCLSGNIICIPEKKQVESTTEEVSYKSILQKTQDILLDRKMPSIMSTFYLIIAIASFCCNWILITSPEEIFHWSLILICYELDFLTVIKLLVMICSELSRNVSLRKTLTHKCVIIELLSLIPIELATMFELNVWFQLLHFNRLLRIVIP